MAKRLKRKKKRTPKKGYVSRCPNCGKREAHFVPATMGDDGLFMCDPKYGMFLKGSDA